MLTSRVRNPPVGQRAQNFMNEAAQPSKILQPPLEKIPDKTDETKVDQPLVRVISKKQSELGKYFFKQINATEMLFYRYMPLDENGKPTAQPWSADTFGQFDQLDGYFDVNTKWDDTTEMFIIAAESIYSKMIELGGRDAAAATILDSGKRLDDVGARTTKSNWLIRVNAILALGDKVFDALEGDRGNLVHPKDVAEPTQPGKKVPLEPEHLL